MAGTRGEDAPVLLRHTSKSQGNRLGSGSSSRTEGKRHRIVVGARILATLRRGWPGFAAAGERKPATAIATLTGYAMQRKKGLEAPEVPVDVA